LGVRTFWEWKKPKTNIFDKDELKKSTLELLNVDLDSKIAERILSFNENLKKVSLPEIQKKELRSRMAKVLSEHRHSKEKLDKEKLQKIDRVFDVYMSNSVEKMVLAREVINSVSVVAMMPWIRLVDNAVFDVIGGLAKISNDYDKKYFDSVEEIGASGKILSMAKTIFVDSTVDTYNSLIGNFYRKDENGQKMGFKKASVGAIMKATSIGSTILRWAGVLEFERAIASGNVIMKEGSEKLLAALEEGKIGQAFVQGGKNWLNNADRLLSHFGVHIGGNTEVGDIKNSIEDIKNDPKFVGVIKQGGDVDHTALAIGKAAGISNTKIVEALNNTFVKDINGNMISLSKAELVQAGVKLKYIQGEDGKSFFEVLVPKGGGGFADKEVYHNIIKDNGEKLSRSVNSFGPDKISFNNINKDNINLGGKLDLDHNDILTKNNENVSNIIYKDGHIVNIKNPEILNGKLDLHNDIQTDINKLDIAKDVVKDNVISNNEVTKNVVENMKIDNMDVKFIFDNQGNATGFNIFGGSYGIKDYVEQQKFLVENYSSKISGDSNFNEMAKRVISASASKILKYKKIMDELSFQGKENSEEYAIVKLGLLNELSYTKKNFGDVFRPLTEILKIKTK
jgi:hypothetical protein